MLRQRHAGLRRRVEVGAVRRATRRKLLIALGTGVLAAPFACFAQQQGKVWRVGYLTSGSRPVSLDAGNPGVFRRGMRELGYVEGKNLVIEVIE